MVININKAYHNLLLFVGIILTGIIISIVVNAILLHMTSTSRAILERKPVVTDVANADPVVFVPVAASQTVIEAPGSLEGFIPPLYPNAPTPDQSAKSNNIVENLLMALKYYTQVPADKAMGESIIGWDGETGYGLMDSSILGTRLRAFARNTRYLLILKTYQKYFPQIKYFDDDIARVQGIMDKMLDPAAVKDMLKGELMVLQIPGKLYYDLMDLSKLTGDKRYRDAALIIGGDIANLVTSEALRIRNNSDRSMKVGTFNYAAIGYLMGKETGNLNLIRDSEQLMSELIKELWSPEYSLMFTDSTIGQFGNVTSTFITNDQMNAAYAMAKYAQVSKDPTAINTTTAMLQSLMDGVNPLCDKTRRGFFRRYNGDSNKGQEDFKFSEDHINYLGAWVQLNILENGKYDNAFSREYELYENFLYRTETNAIYLEYDMTFMPYKSTMGREIASTDVILDMLLLILQDREFHAEKAVSGI